LEICMNANEKTLGAAGFAMVSIGRLLPHPRAALPSASDSDGACDTRIRVGLEAAISVSPVP
jgi:hypothetical protein